MSNHGGEKARANFLAMIFNRSEMIPIMQAAMASLAFSGFEAHRNVSFLTKPLDSLDEFVTVHEIA